VNDTPLVLVVDDFPDNREMHAEYPRFAGFRVAEAGGHDRSALEAGCDAFVTKPCLPEELVRHLRELLEAPSAKARSKPGRR
jgi:CheY-like chemotaxis protein